MEHLPFNIICRIADGDLSQKEEELYLNHWKSCQYCQKEIDLQRSIVKESRKVKLINPKDTFTQDIMEIINPSKKKKWAEWLLHNMGNIIAMALVLTFLGYIFSITNTGAFQNDKSSKYKSVTEFMKIIQNDSQQIESYIISKFHTQAISTFYTNTITYAFLAIILLVLIDRIAGYFFRRLRLNV